MKRVDQVRQTMLDFAKILMLYISETSSDQDLTSEDLGLVEPCYVSIRSIWDFSNKMGWKEISEEIDAWGADPTLILDLYRKPSGV